MATAKNNDWMRWAEMVRQTIDADWENLSEMTEDGLTLKPIYPHNTIMPNSAFTEPGWLIAQFVADEPDAETLNRSILDELEGGANMVMLPLSSTLHTSAEYLRNILKGVYTDACLFGYPQGGDTLQWASAWAEFATSLDHDSHALNVHLGADPIADVLIGLHSNSTIHDQAITLADWQVRHRAELSSIKCFAVAGDAYHRYGLTDGQELALGLASLVWQLRILEQSGSSLESALSGSVLRIAVTSDLYSSLSKTRAAHMLLNQLVTVLGVSHDNKPALHVFTSDRMMTRIEPMNNVLRHVTASLGAALGGAKLITSLPHDWLSGSTAMSRRLARNIQLIMQDEARLDQVADPAHGASSLEALSQSLAHTAWQIFQNIEKAGGAMSAVTSDMVGDWAAAAIQDRQNEMDNRSSAMLGINHHPQQATDRLPELVMETDKPRGGTARPAQPWEDLRVAAFDKELRCLILDDGESDKKHIARWVEELRMAGIQTAEISITDTANTEQQIAAAKPHGLIANASVHSMLSKNHNPMTSLPFFPLNADGITRRQMIMTMIERAEG